MIKITFMGAGSTVFAKNVIGDIMLCDELHNCEIALYDINNARLSESEMLLSTLNKNCNKNRAVIKSYLGVENRKEALRGADFVVNAVNVGGYKPSTVIDFEIPKKYGLRQTIADTLGIGGIFRALRTIPVMRDFAEDIEEVCPNAWFLNYTNPMAMLSGFMERYTNVKTVGLCHSVQVCSSKLLERLGIPSDGIVDKIAGINHMAWLLEIRDKDGNDLYPEIKRLAAEKNANEKHTDMVRFEYIRRLGYYCTESSEHNAEYNPFFIKPGYPELIDKYNIPLILVSMGKEGSRAYYEDKIVEVKPFLQKNTIETTGAGDTFCGCVLHYICEHGLDNLTETDLTEMLTFANAAAARITTRKGALRVMPDRAEIEAVMKK